MGPISKIMAAVDFSEHSKATLKFAAFLAGSVNATLVVAENASTIGMWKPFAPWRMKILVFRWKHLSPSSGRNEKP